MEADPEYLLIVEANNIAAEIDDEMNTVHKFARYNCNSFRLYRVIYLANLIIKPLKEYIFPFTHSLTHTLTHSFSP